MRIILAITLGLGFALPAAAAVEDDFAAANRMFGQISPASTLENLGGEWLPLATLANLEGKEPAPGQIASYLEKFCDTDPGRGATVTVGSGTSFTMDIPGRLPLTVRYDWLGGSQFARSLDPDTLFESRGLDKMEGERGDEMRASALQQAASVASVYRVSPDILVVAASPRAEIYGRCP